ncbi:MAG: glycosyltransferase family A protein [Sulfuricurvum sp.]|jgi:glycosyltransferase involved in cell wall biosynthesis
MNKNSSVKIHEIPKFTNRALQCEHTVIKKRIEYLDSLDYKVYSHQECSINQNIPVFTIVLTIYDANISYIKDSLESVLSQTYKNTEIILINNGAKGVVHELIKDNFLNNKNVKFIDVAYHQYNPLLNDLEDPIPNLWNAGLFCSVGNYIYFLSYDDILSSDYVEKMVNLFMNNSECQTAAPSVVSINNEGEINKERTYFLKMHNKRYLYTNGIELAKDFMNKGEKILSPGGVLASKSDLVFHCGGFDNINDQSQIFKFAVHGDSGFDESAKLYWRHHEAQANKKQTKKGLIYYRNYSEFSELYNIYKLHNEIGGEDFAKDFEKYIHDLAVNGAIDSFRDSYLNHGIIAGIHALIETYNQCPKDVFKRILHYTLKDFPKMLLINYAPKLFRNKLRNLKYRFLQSAFFKIRLLTHLKKDRLHYPEYSELDAQGVDFTFIEYRQKTTPPNLILHDISNKVVHLLNKEWLERKDNIEEDLNFVFDYNNHYLLLSALAQVRGASNIVEIGTAAGTSLWAWLRSDSVKLVNTWDINPLATNKGWFSNEKHMKLVEDSIYSDTRWKQHIENLTDSEVWSNKKHLFENADIIFIDGPHDGIFEDKLLGNILNLKNEKDILLVFDDILLSSMIDFWHMLALPKLDITSIGHQSGTGLALLEPHLMRK